MPRGERKARGKADQQIGFAVRDGENCIQIRKGFKIKGTRTRKHIFEYQIVDDQHNDQRKSHGHARRHSPFKLPKFIKFIVNVIPQKVKTGKRCSPRVEGQKTAKKNAFFHAKNK